MKRLISLFLVSMILTTTMICGFCVNAFAAGTPTIKGSEISCKAGDTVDFTIKIENNPGIVALRIFAEYNTLGLKLKSVSDGEIFGVGNSTFNDNLNAEKYTMLWVDGDSTENYSGNGTLVTMTFEVLPNAFSTEEIKITYDARSTFDKELNGVTFDVVNGKINVVPSTVPVAGVSLDKTSLNIRYKDSAQLIAFVSPENATDKNVTWSSSNESVAKVDANGKITTHKRGSATITATSADGTKSASCSVTVSFAWWQWIIYILLFGFLWY